METAMQNLKYDLIESIFSAKDTLSEIENLEIRTACQQSVIIVLKTIIERIDNELLNKKKQQIIGFADDYGFNICGYDYDKAEQYYNKIFNR